MQMHCVTFVSYLIHFWEETAERRNKPMLSWRKRVGLLNIIIITKLRRQICDIWQKYVSYKACPALPSYSDIIGPCFGTQVRSCGMGCTGAMTSVCDIQSKCLWFPCCSWTQLLILLFDRWFMEPTQVVSVILCGTPHEFVSTIKQLQEGEGNEPRPRQSADSRHCERVSAQMCSRAASNARQVRQVDNRCHVLNKNTDHNRDNVPAQSWDSHKYLASRNKPNLLNDHFRSHIWR